MRYNSSRDMIKKLPNTNPVLIPPPRLIALVIVLLLLLIPLYFMAPAASAYFIPPAASGSCDDIRVVSNEREVSFPDGVTFNLEVEGGADIAEVRLHYRVPPSEIWAYAYLDVVPSRRVDTSFDIPLSGARYVPPGTEMEYHYFIRDACDNTLTTPSETFVYLDNRFEWETVHVGPLTVFWHDLSQERVQEVAQQVESSLHEVSDLLGVELDEPMRGVIYNSRAESRAAFPHQSRTTDEEQVFQGFAFPDRRAFVGVGLQPGLIVHEATHLLLEEVMASPRARLPAWVNEGFASYVEPGYHRRFTGGADPRIMPLRYMYSVPGRPESIRYFYRKAESVVGYLLETYGAEKFRTLLDELNEGETTDRAFIAAYGVGLEELDQQWASSLGHGGLGRAGGDTGGPFAYLSTVLIAAIALVVVVAMTTGFVTRKLRKRMEGPGEWDGLTEEEWRDRP